ncbi:MAG: hypothetical protein ACI3W8_03760 [Oscillospiraceae bacterium]
MSSQISQWSGPDEGGRPPWVSCRTCRRKDCPHAYEQAIRRAAAQGYAAAQLLTEEAGQLLKTVSCAGDLRSLLSGSEAMEQALSQTLEAELALIQELRAQAADRCPFQCDQ